MNPTALHNYLLATAFLANLAVSLVTLGKVLRGAPEKREVRLAETYASKDEAGLLRADVTTLREQVRADKNEILRALDDRARAMHERIDSIIDQIPWRILELLKSKGTLK